MTAQTEANKKSAGAEVDFFARMTASISHELKNVLAIVNENAGLLDDLLLMAEKGRPLNPERLKRLADNVKRQVERGDLILGRLNRFAHTVYDPVGQIDVRAFCELVAALTGRLAAMQEVKVEVAPCDKVPAEVHPFALANALWLLLKNIFPLAQGETSIVLQPALIEQQPCVDLRIQGISGPALDKAVAAALEEEGDIFSALGAGGVALTEGDVVRFCLGERG